LKQHKYKHFLHANINSKKWWTAWTEFWRS